MMFVVRTIFIKVLGENLLGLDGLFTNILLMLSMAELGIKAIGQFTDFPASPFVYPCGKISFPRFCHLQREAFER